MFGILERPRFRLVGVATIGLAVALLATPTRSEAAGYSLTYTGTVTDVTGSLATAGIAIGDQVSGTVTYDPFNTDNPDTTPSPGMELDSFDESAASFTFSVKHGAVENFYSHADTGSASILNVALGFPNPEATGLDFLNTGSDSNLQIDYSVAGAYTPLYSLSGMPSDVSALLAFLGGTPAPSIGGFELSDGAVQFDLALTSPVAATPIPGTLPLFGAGLAAIGFVAWRRPTRAILRAAA
jgi:hypothetical protein